MVDTARLRRAGIIRRICWRHVGRVDDTGRDSDAENSDILHDPQFGARGQIRERGGEERSVFFRKGSRTGLTSKHGDGERYL